MLPNASGKAEFFVKIFTENSNLDDASSSLSVFTSLTNLKLHNILVTPKMVNAITDLTSTKASGPHYISTFQW